MSNAAIRWVQTEEQHNRIRQPDAQADRQSTRFIWLAREDIPHAEVLGGTIERCRIMPVVRWLKWDRIDDVPLEFREPGMLRRDGEGKLAYAAYATLPGYIFDAIMDSYRDQGIVELTALRGMDAAQFAALKIDELFFPQRKIVDEQIDETPQNYAEMRASMSSTLSALEMDAYSYDMQQRAILTTCAREMLRAINVAERFDTALVDESEGELELGRNNPTFKQKYDRADLSALKRLSRPRKDAFMKRLADQQIDLQTTVREALTANQTQASNVQEIALAVGSAVAAEFAKIFAGQRGIPIQETASPVAVPVDPEQPKSQAAESEQTKGSNQGKQPKFQGK